MSRMDPSPRGKRPPDQPPRSQHPKGTGYPIPPRSDVMPQEFDIHDVNAHVTEILAVEGAQLS